MKRAVKREWTADLRSGDFKQGFAALGYIHMQDGEDHYCCWGVLCEQAVRKGIIPPPRKDGVVFAYGANEERHYIPQEVADWAELPNRGGPLSEYGDLARMNDDHKVPFTGIADKIDREL